MHIELRELNAIVILDLKGKITVDDGQTLSTTVSRLLQAGWRTIVLNLVDVPYIDSMGLREFVVSYQIARAERADLWFCDLSERVGHLLSMAKLLTVFLSGEVSDLASLLPAQPLVATCPVCGPDASIPLRAVSEYQTCGACGIQVKIPAWPSDVDDEASAECAIARWQTYDGEFVHVCIGEVQLVTFDGRVDLFASEIGERVWRLLPLPRRVVFNVALDTYTDDGLQTLLHICSTSTEESRSAIAISGLDDESRDRMPPHPSVHDGVANALKALNWQGQQLPRLRLSIRKA